MAEPVNAATASVPNDADDADDLYADLDEHVAAALAAAGESGGSNGRDSDPATDGEEEVPEVYANEAVDLGDGTSDYSSSEDESDDGLHIVLNEDAGAPLSPLPPAAGSEGYVAEDKDREDSGSRVKVQYVTDGRGKFGGFQCKGLLERTTVPITGQGDGGHQHVFQRDFNFFLPRNSTIFDINIEAFQLKPWRQHGVDPTDYFNFGLDEQSWRKYWLSTKQVRQGSRSLANVSSGLEPESCTLKQVRQGSKSLANFEGTNVLAKPKGRAIHVENSVCERVPSADMWRPVQRDSDVVIQINMMHSPSNQSTSDDISTSNQRHVTEGRISIDHHGDGHLKNGNSVVRRVVDNEVCDRDSSEYTGNKLYSRDSARARDRSSSPGYSDTLSEESKEDLYFKSEIRHSDSMDFYEDTKHKDEHVKSNLYCHSSESDRRNSKNDYLGHLGCSYTLSPVNVKHQKAAKLSWRDEQPFAAQGRSKELLINCKSGRRLPNSGGKARREKKRQPLAPGSRAVFDEQAKSTYNYTRSSDRKYGQKISSSTSQRNNYHNAVHGESYGKHDYPYLKIVALRNHDRYLNNGSMDHHRPRSSWRKCTEEDVAEGFSSPEEWRKHENDGYDSMLEAEVSNGSVRQMYRERYYEETRIRHDRNWDDEFLHYSDYRFRRPQSPDVRDRYNYRVICAKRNDENLKHHEHLAWDPQAKLNNYQDWPAAGLTSVSSRNRYVGNKRIHNARMMRCHYDGYHQNKRHHVSQVFSDSIAECTLYTDAVAEAGRCFPPVKRKLPDNPGSMNHNDLADLALSKGRRLVHNQSVVSDRNIDAVKLHNYSKEFDAEVTFCSNDMTKSTTVSNLGAKARLEPGKCDKILLNDRKIKFKRRGNQLIRVVENDSKGCVSVGDELHCSKHKDKHRKMWGQAGHSGNQGWEKQNEEDAEIEEGELIEHDEQEIISKGKLSKPKKTALKSVINVTTEDTSCKDRASVECDDKRILEVMAKMQKRRERFKEAILSQNGSDDGVKQEPLDVACRTDDIRNQRPARKRLWVGVS